VEEKVRFIFNNITLPNLDVKVREMLALVTSDFFPWLAQYIVVKRVALEQNYQQMYQAMLERVNSSVLDKLVLQETYSNVKILLYSDKTLANSSERGLLKNLGIWLGSLTLAKNKPILYKVSSPCLLGLERGL